MTKLIIIMIGLPARGKSYISHKLNRYFNWCGIKSNIFNVGNYRREKYGSSDYHFFLNENKLTRDQLAESVLIKLIKWILEKDNKIAIFDATNSTQDRRSNIIRLINEFKIDNLNVCFIESVCDIKEIIDTNISMKSSSPDYIDVEHDYMINDFNKRMASYIENHNEFNLSEIKEYKNMSYLKITNINELFTIFNVSGLLLSNIMSFLLNCLSLTLR